jgi:NTP pyrophosphatase (non-canonical NTP hydrolase)
MRTLTFEALRRINVTRCLKWQPNGLGEWSPHAWVTAVGGEVGEALNVVKKLNRERDGLVGNSRSFAELLADLGDELADAAIYLDLAMASEGLAPFADEAEPQSFGELRAFNLAGVEATVRTEPDLLSIRSTEVLAELGNLASAMGGHGERDEVELSGANLLGAIDKLAAAMGIDLGEAVVTKFNRTSEKRGFPDRLHLEDIPDEVAF